MRDVVQLQRVTAIGPKTITKRRKSHGPGATSKLPKRQLDAAPILTIVEITTSPRKLPEPKLEVVEPEAKEVPPIQERIRDFPEEQPALPGIQFVGYHTLVVVEPIAGEAPPSKAVFEIVEEQLDLPVDSVGTLPPWETPATEGASAEELRPKSKRERREALAALAALSQELEAQSAPTPIEMVSEAEPKAGSTPVE